MDRDQRSQPWCSCLFAFHESKDIESEGFVTCLISYLLSNARKRAPLRLPSVVARRFSLGGSRREQTHL